jgi:membrane protease YdiL (CAAX protease family)
MKASSDSQMTVARLKFPWLFLLLSYGLTWVFWIPIALTRQDYQGSPFLLAMMLLGVFGPGIAGILLTYREQGKTGGRDFWQRVIDVRRIRPIWIGLILILIPVMHLISIAINHWLGGNPPEFTFIKENSSQPLGILLVIVLYLLQAALEELGWRGFLLDRFQARWSPLAASIVLGVIHTFWHAPLFFIVGTNQSRWALGIETWLFFAFVLAGSIYSTWCYNENRRSTLSVILLHTVVNLCLDTFLLPGSGEWIFKILFALSALVIAVIWAAPARMRMHQMA